jgi:hypothetical protein
MKPFKNLIYIFFMLSGMLMGSQAVAADANGGYGTVGVRSCAVFLQEFEAKALGQVAIQAWLAGYITAYNAQTPNTNQILGNSDLLGAELWVKNYCEKNPLKNIANAAESLMIELYPKRATKAPN